MNRTARPGAALATALAVWLAAPVALAEQPLPVYPGTIHTRIGNDLVIAGEYYRIAYFTTSDSMRKVAKYFYDQWKKDGYPTTVDGNFVDEGFFGASQAALISSILSSEPDPGLMVSSRPSSSM